MGGCNAEAWCEHVIKTTITITIIIIIVHPAWLSR